MNVPDDLYYSSDHEWIRVEDGRFRIGITDYAQDALGDVVFVHSGDVGFAGLLARIPGAMGQSWDIGYSGHTQC